MIASPATRLTLLVSVRDKAGRRRLQTELVRRAQRSGMAGATVLEAAEGYGSSGRLHKTHLVSDDAPVAVVLVDRPEKVEWFLGRISDVLDSVLAIQDAVEILDLRTMDAP